MPLVKCQEKKIWKKDNGLEGGVGVSKAVTAAYKDSCPITNDLVLDDDRVHPNFV
jgi:hypothetical protein